MCHVVVVGRCSELEGVYLSEINYQSNSFVWQAARFFFSFSRKFLFPIWGKVRSHVLQFWSRSPQIIILVVAVIWFLRTEVSIIVMVVLQLVSRLMHGFVGNYLWKSCIDLNRIRFFFFCCCCFGCTCIWFRSLCVQKSMKIF